jgi:hypothetical protein
MRISLEIHHFGPPPVTAPQIEEIGRRYIKRTFIRFDGVGRTRPFCKTDDGFPVFYKGSWYKLIGKGNNLSGFRTVDPTRVQRLHWIVPIIEGRARSVQVMEDGKKRRYYVNPLKYLVVLNKCNEGFLLVTAYRITEQWEKERTRKQFGIKMPAIL